MKFKIIGVTMFCLCLLASCSNRKIVKNRKEFVLSGEDSAFVEEELIAYRKVLFSYIYLDSRKETYARKKLLLCENELRDLTNYFNSNYSPYLIKEDDNLEKMLRKWLDKKVYIPIAQPPDHPDGSLDLARALDFYESEDLKSYLDSLRNSEYKRILALKKN